MSHTYWAYFFFHGVMVETDDILSASLSTGSFLDFLLGWGVAPMDL